MQLRIATFNLENLDDVPGQEPALDTRIALMRPQLLRVNADVLCVQEANGQEEPGQPRRLLALRRLLETTPYFDFHVVSTATTAGQVFNERNLVILSRFPIIAHAQHKHDAMLGALAPLYRMVTADPPEATAETITWERPILHAQIQLPDGRTLHTINVHLKSKLPVNVPGQMLDQYRWKTARGWAEGFFVASMKRVGQALETRLLVDHLLDADPDALIVLCGDFNAEADETAIEALVGAVENTGNETLAGRVLTPCELSIPESARYSLLHLGKGRMLDHVLMSRALLRHYRGVEIHNELLHDESIAFATDRRYPESDHAPVVAEFDV